MPLCWLLTRQFEEPDVPCACNCSEDLPPQEEEEEIPVGLVVDRTCSAVDVSTLTDDSNTINNSINDDRLANPAPDEYYDCHNDEQCDKFSVEVIAKVGGNSNNKSNWLSNVLQKRRANQTRQKHIKACCNSTTTPKTLQTLDTVDETCCVSSEGEEGEHHHHEDNPHMSRNGTANGRRTALTLKLDEYDNEQFENLMKQLKNRTDLTELEIYRNNPGKDGRGAGTRSMSDLGAFFSEVGGLTQLQELVLWNFNPDTSWLLTCFLKERPILRSFRLHYSRGSINNDLTKALVQLPTLTDVVLEMQQDFALDILFTSSSLRNLKINGLYHVGRRNFARAMRILGRNNHTLRILDLKPEISSVSIRDLSEAIQQNQTMEKLYFSFRDDDVDVSGEALIDLTHALTKNHSLKEVVNRNHHSVQVSNNQKATACASLASNKILERFQFYNESACVDSLDGTGTSNQSSISDPPQVQINHEAISNCFVSWEAIHSWFKR
jgi:hypothetical protein